MRQTRCGFTLIELLVVMAVIAILVTLVLRALPGIWSMAGRSRAQAEIKSLETALSSFNMDSGVYPPGSAGGYDPTAYVSSAVSLYTNLSGRLNESAPVTGRVYVSFKKSQLNTSGDQPYMQDPFGYAYGYCTNAPNAGNNPGFYDLWSTSGKTDDSEASTNLWVTNWRGN